MSLKKYMLDRWKTTFLLLFALLTTQIFMLLYQVGAWLRWYMIITMAGAYVLGNALEYYNKKRFYADIYHKLEELDQKYLIMELLENTETMEEEQLAEILRETGKSMLENVNAFRSQQEEYKEYIEMWIHEVKLPIATAKMIIENNKSEVTRKMEEELNEIENYTQQALYYARSNHTQKDYFVAKTSLVDMINDTVKQNKRALIGQKIKIQIHLDNEELFVYTDAKWCHFIFNQVVQNSIKYKREENAVLIFQAEEMPESVVLSIVDNGIGIKAEEVSRVFDKGFCGTNGRGTKKATGIGLYLCKKLCLKLGLGITLESKEGEGTSVSIIFPRGSYIRDSLM